MALQPPGKPNQLSEKLGLTIFSFKRMPLGDLCSNLHRWLKSFNVFSSFYILKRTLWTCLDISIRFEQWSQRVSPLTSLKCRCSCLASTPCRKPSRPLSWSFIRWRSPQQGRARLLGFSVQSASVRTRANHIKLYAIYNILYAGLANFASLKWSDTNT